MFNSSLDYLAGKMVSMSHHFFYSLYTLSYTQYGGNATFCLYTAIGNIFMILEEGIVLNIEWKGIDKVNHI